MSPFALAHAWGAAGMKPEISEDSSPVASAGEDERRLKTTAATPMHDEVNGSDVHEGILVAVPRGGAIALDLEEDPG